MEHIFGRRPALHHRHQNNHDHHPITLRITALPSIISLSMIAIIGPPSSGVADGRALRSG